MSIGKRLIDLARAELNSLLDRAAQFDHTDDDDRDGSSGDRSSMSDAEWSAEIERRRQARAEAEEAAHGPRARPEAPRASARPSSAPPRRRTAAGDEAIRKAYAALETPAGSNFETVRRSYRRLMRKYHPDLHGGTPDKQRTATDISQGLTEAYKILERHLRR